MGIGVAVAIVLAAGDAKTITIANPGFSFVNVDAKAGEVYSDYFSRQVELHAGVRVTGPTELRAVLGLERQRQMLGCSESGCLAELAGALGVEYVIVGSLARAGTGWVVNIKVIHSRDASAAAVFSSRPKDENALLDFLSASANTLAKQLVGGGPVSPSVAERPPEAAVVTTPAAAPDRAWMFAAGWAGLLLAGGGVTYGMAASRQSSLTQGTGSYPTQAALSEARFEGERLQAESIALFASGAVAAGSAAVMLTLPAASPVRKWEPVVASGATLVSGVVLVGLAAGEEGKVKAGPWTSLSALEDQRASGERAQASGWVLMGAGAAGLAGSLLLMKLAPNGSTTVSVTPLAGGAAASLRMELQ